MSKKSNPFTEPKLSTQKNRPWYVWFRFLDEATGKKVFKVFKGNANTSGMSRSERLAELNSLKEVLIFKLKVQGWNPLNNTYSKPASDEEINLERLQEMTFQDSLQYARKKKLPDWAKKTRQDYDSKIKYLSQAALDLGFAYKKVVELRRIHYRNLLDHIRQSRKLTAAGYNIYRDCAACILHL